MAIMGGAFFGCALISHGFGAGLLPEALVQAATTIGLTLGVFTVVGAGHRVQYAGHMSRGLPYTL